MLSLAAIIGFTALLYISLNRRTQELLRQMNHELPVEPKQSAFSQAAVDLLATAGGIYLALLLIRNFLQITVPDEIVIYGFQLEPLAALSLLVAVFQPYLSTLIRRQ